MAIHPHYADAIVDGEKHVEFRKRPLAADIDTVVIYATAPIKRIVGEFTVDRTLIASPDELWDAVGSLGAIDEASYSAYYADSTMAAGIVVGTATRYSSPIPLEELHPSPAVPQSFAYLPATHLARLRRAG
jgi:predicted transcriptional regulator